MAAATPARPVPGAFFNTPAPGTRVEYPPIRRRLFEDGSSGNTSNTQNRGVVTQQQQGQVVPQSETASLPPLLRAAKSVNTVLQNDESYPDLDSYCKLGASSEYDVQSPDGPWAPFQKTHNHPIPDAIFEHFNHGQLTTQMGLFAEINHAWVFIDNALYLWDYTHPHPEVIGYEESTTSIRAVALVAPKAGVFVASITHILVVATAVDITLLGVSATTTPSGAKAISLFQTKMVVSRGTSDVSIIAATADGRIFVGGDTDTDIHEIFYQQEEKWFSSRCGKINHSNPGWASVVPNIPVGQLWSSREPEHLVEIVVDDSRKLVYTLSSKSTIRTYYLEGPNKLTKVIEKAKNDCLRDVAHMITPSPLLTDRMSIVAISPITSQESAKLHLMALTDTGCRLFMSATSSSSYMVNASSSQAPQSMQVQFVKFPATTLEPNPTDQSRQLTELNRFGKRFAPGYFLAFVVREGSDGDTLFVSSPDTARIKHTKPASALKYYEQGNWIDLGPRSRFLAIGQITRPFAAARQPLGFGNELALQFEEAPSEFAIITNDGIHVVRRRRFVDIFASVVRNSQGDDGLERDTRKFMTLYGRVETISAALAVSCGQGSSLRTGTARAVDQTAEDKARTAFVTFGGAPTVPEVDGTMITADAVKLSARHDALVLYLARLVRVLWKARVIAPKVTPTGIVINSTIPTGKLTIVQENLERLRTFLRVNAGSIQGLSGPPAVQNSSTRHEEMANQAEHQAFHALQKLMESISEGISFVLMLFDERVSDIYLRLDDASRQQLNELTFENLFSQDAGKELAKLLVKAIVNRNIESGSNVETVADALRRRCGSFCSPDDVVIFKAQEQLQRASEQAANPNLARTLLNESLRLFERVAANLSYNNLKSAVEQYTELKYFAGAIQLCLVVAKEKDRGNAALAWMKEGKAENDPRKSSFQERKRCYDLIHDVLSRLDEGFRTEPESIDGRPTMAATKRNEAYAVVNDSEDEVFHFDLYEWYLEQDWTDRILAIESPHVITFLQDLASREARHADLLCRFYTNRGRYFDAAQVQAMLANGDFAIGIKERITLLSRAKGNANVTTTGIPRQQQQQLDQEVTQLLEIAHIQDDLLERLSQDDRVTPDRLVEIRAALDGQIQSLTELFNGYADQANYYDLCLLIYHAADYHNPRVITDTWRNLIERENARVVDLEEKYQVDRAAGTLQPGESEPPKPYEAVVQHVQSIAHRTSLDSLVFPIDTLLEALCEYAITNGQDASIGADANWPVMLFLGLGVSHAMILRVLEGIHDKQEAPFTQRRRLVVVEWIDYTVETWWSQVERRGGNVKGESVTSPWVGELLERAEQTVAEIAGANNIRGGRAAGGATEVLNRTRKLRGEIAGAGRMSMGGSLRFR